jgi:hypothetical protein
VFALAALAEIGGAWLVWQGVREQRGLAFVGVGLLALGLYGLWPPSNPTPTSGASWLPTAGCSWSAPWAGASWSTASDPTAMTWWAPPFALLGGPHLERVDEVWILRFRDGRIVHVWSLEDTLGRLQQLGLA